MASLSSCSESYPAHANLRQLTTQSSLAVIFFATIVLAPIVGFVGTRFKRQREISCIGFLGFCAMGATMSTVKVTSENQTYGYAVLGGLGLACGITSLTTAAQLTVPADLM